ncbi:hypothetical protein [uncultured Tateyamaria sp.]|uniref:hypothetical protein n=1 Tax=uncultured Tateyamaria sp. TaxID=455651 RepID=UPI00261C9F87|nr:hypothetical protein [uncultured Tateyamaria sp.]
MTLELTSLYNRIQPENVARTLGIKNQDLAKLLLSCEALHPHFEAALQKKIGEAGDVYDPVLALIMSSQVSDLGPLLRSVALVLNAHVLAKLSSAGDVADLMEWAGSPQIFPQIKEASQRPATRFPQVAVACREELERYLEQLQGLIYGLLTKEQFQWFLLTVPEDQAPNYVPFPEHSAGKEEFKALLHDVHRTLVEGQPSS